MPISGDLYAFTEEIVKNAPDQAGVYALFDGDEVIDYGRAQGGSVTIRSRLQDHFSGREGPCTQAATAYMREITSYSVSREKELQGEYLRIHGMLPRCNDRIG